MRIGKKFGQRIVASLNNGKNMMGDLPDKHILGKHILGRHWREPDGYHIDVSALPPPEPMVAILQLIERPDFEGPLIVHHNREPVHLYPELVERGWTHEIIIRKPGTIQLMLSKGSTT